MTLIKQLRSGTIPTAVHSVAQAENIEVGELARLIEAGRVVVPRNKLNPATEPVGIGERLKIKVNANIGTSADYTELSDELEKTETALRAGADTLMDLSTGGDIKSIRRSIRAAWNLPLGTVPVYQALVDSAAAGRSMVDSSADDFFAAVKEQAEDGVDFFTIHAGVTRDVVDVLAAKSRVTGIVSRGGAFMAAWMIHHDRENPFYSEFDRLLDILIEYDAVLSLGDGLRPGSLADATDDAQLAELRVLGKLVERARDRGVQVVVEGPGHVPLDEIETNVALEKSIANSAPFYVLGPLVTDVGAGHDHIVAAIGGAIAGMAGADWLCCVTPREHLGLPTAADIRAGVIASRIAGHAADVVRRPGSRQWDLEMAQARKALKWDDQLSLALDSEQAGRSYHERPGATENCTMCSGFCAMKLISDYFEVEGIAGCQLA
jgi:phosphomethylpyrimidine synthase